MQSPLVLACSTWFVVACPVVAQCALQWRPGDGIPGVDLTVNAVIEWDRDGAGPLPRLFVVGGEFSVAGDVLANNVAAFDPVAGTWSALGSGTNDMVKTMTVSANGDLIVGGRFSSAGGVPAPLVARWNGTTWSAVGSPPFNHHVQHLATLASGDVVAAGMSPSGVARWDGTSWLPVGSGVSEPIDSMLALANGDLVVGGSQFVSGSVLRWDGATWSPLGPALTSNTWNGQVGGFVELLNGDLIAAGTFDHAGSVVLSNVARWDGSAWSSLGAGIGETALTMARLSGGQLWVAAASFYPGPNFLYQWDGASWSTLPWDPTQAITRLCASASGDVVAGGVMQVAGAANVENVARWDGSAWTAMGSGTNGAVRGFLPLPGGDVLALGQFTTIGGVAANRVARWNGSTWSALGSGIANGWASCATLLPNGDIVVGGWFGAPGASGLLPCVARWDGVTWSTIGTFLGQVFALVTMPNGDVVAGGSLAGGTVANIARWDGATWSPLGVGLNSGVNGLAVMPNGELVAGGGFWMAGGAAIGPVARWDGAAWHSLGSGVSGTVQGVAPLANGELIAIGWFTAGGVPGTIAARWNGTSWSAFGGGFIGTAHSLLVLPNGDLAVCGNLLAAGSGLRPLQRWNGSVWSDLGSNLGGQPRCLAMLPDGSLAVGGGTVFVANGAVVGSSLAQLESTCAAAVVSAGAGCSGPAGPNQLAASGLPWTGTTWSSVGTGLPASALVCAIAGFAPTSLPLAAVFATALPGCVLHANPDLIDLQVASGTATWQLTLPNAPSLAGIVLHHQMVSIALDATSAVTATNSLVATVGSF